MRVVVEGLNGFFNSYQHISNRRRSFSQEGIGAAGARLPWRPPLHPPRACGLGKAASVELMASFLSLSSMGRSRRSRRKAQLNYYLNRSPRLL